MEAIWKYDLMPNFPHLQIVMPRGSKILKIGQQAGKPVMWALVCPYAEKIVRDFYLFETGQEAAFMDHLEYLGTFQIPDGSQEYVKHVFQYKDPR